jgi:hypothetical protein
MCSGPGVGLIPEMFHGQILFLKSFPCSHLLSPSDGDML